MTILLLLALMVIVAALAGVWRARDRGASAMQSSIMLLVVAIVAVIAAWLVIRRS
jgi:hypothetical protein